MINIPEIKKIIYTEDEIKKKVLQIAKEISEDYKGKELVMVGVLKSSLYFFADLTRAMDIPVLLDFIELGQISQRATQKGIVRITKDLNMDISGKHVILVEDIIRSGLTIGYIVQNFLARSPASVKICSLLTNPTQQIIQVPIEYSGFEFDNARLIGYGFDIEEVGRNLPYIAEVKV